MGWAKVGDEVTLPGLYGVPGVSSVAMVSELVRFVAVVDTDELVSFREGGDPSDCRTWFSLMAESRTAWFLGLSAGRREARRESSLLLGSASVKVETGFILWLAHG